MIKTTQRIKLIIWSVIGLVFILILVWLNLFFIPKKIESDKGKVSDSLINIELNYRQKQNISNLTKQLEQIQESSVELSNVFYDRTQPLKFVEYIEDLAKKNDLEQDINVTEPSRTAVAVNSTYTVEEKSFSLNLTGQTENILNFLKSFEENETYVLITNLEIRNNTNGTASFTISGLVPWH
ncbi:MAG: hypothetical protein WCT08_01750 [Patescibacteria group bacterium]|jgi:hypothetical protein